MQLNDNVGLGFIAFFCTHGNGLMIIDVDRRIF
jgi:hypothetical protein